LIPQKNNNNDGFFRKISKFMALVYITSKYGSNYVWILTFAAAANAVLRATPAGENWTDGLVRGTASIAFVISFVLFAALLIFDIIEKMKGGKSYRTE
jgi:hypothetical protein